MLPCFIWTTFPLLTHRSQERMSVSISIRVLNDQPVFAQAMRANVLHQPDCLGMSRISGRKASCPIATFLGANSMEVAKRKQMPFANRRWPSVE